MDTTTGGVEGAAGVLEAARLIVDVALLVGSATLVAVRATDCAELIVAGAVYRPLTTVPKLGLSDQVTAVSELPLTVAANCFDWPAVRDGALGLSEMLTAVVAGVVVGATVGDSMIVALVVWLGKAMLVAEIVTSESALTELGAV